MTSLASLTDLGVRLGLDLTGNARAQALLDDVSAAVRDYCGRDFTTHTITETVDVCCGTATLTHGPVVSIQTVTLNSDAIDYTWTEGQEVSVSGGYLKATFAYTYGDAAVPATVKAIVCQVAGRAYGTTPQEGATTSETIGQHSITIGSTAAAGPLGLLADEEARLAKYRNRPLKRITQETWVPGGRRSADTWY